jgi:hypothetical protein
MINSFGGNDLISFRIDPQFKHSSPRLKNQSSASKESKEFTASLSATQ